MRKTQHKPPSRIRYEKSHPTVSCRLDEETYDLLKQRLEELGGVSVADFVKDALGHLQLKMPDLEDIEDMKEEERDSGYAEARELFQIWCYCSVCGKKIDVEPNSNAHKAMIGYMKEHGWAHASCLDAQGKRRQDLRASTAKKYTSPFNTPGTTKFP